MSGYYDDPNPCDEADALLRALVEAFDSNYIHNAEELPRMVKRAGPHFAAARAYLARKDDA